VNRIVAAVFLLFLFSHVLAECNGESWAPDSRYELKGEEVYDTQTKLTWKRCAEGMSWNGSTCTGKPGEMSWDAAMTGYSASGKDWRLPSKDELGSLRAGSQFQERSGCWEPAINTQVFPGGQDVYFWSSTPYAGDSNFVWCVGFGDGVIGSGGRGYGSRGYGGSAIRLVRTGQ